MDRTADVPSELRLRGARSRAMGKALDALKVVGPLGAPHALALRGIAPARPTPSLMSSFTHTHLENP